jgi:hypothetical protein
MASEETEPPPVRETHGFYVFNLWYQWFWVGMMVVFWWLSLVSDVWILMLFMLFFSYWRWTRVRHDLWFYRNRVRGRVE